MGKSCDHYISLYLIYAKKIHSGVCSHVSSFWCDLSYSAKSTTNELNLFMKCDLVLLNIHNIGTSSVSGDKGFKMKYCIGSKMQIFLLIRWHFMCMMQVCLWYGVFLKCLKLLFAVMQGVAKCHSLSSTNLISHLIVSCSFLILCSDCVQFEKHIHIYMYFMSTSASRPSWKEKV